MSRGDLEKLIRSKPITCEVCKGRMRSVGSGVYECMDCKHIMLDDYGRVKKFLEEAGPQPAVVISEATGVSTSFVDMLLRNGKLELPPNSRYFISCRGCGCSIRYGTYCSRCLSKSIGKYQASFSEDAGEDAPKPENGNGDMNGRMRYFNT